jgi:hypothetical protein
MVIQAPNCQISYGDRPPRDLSEAISTAENKGNLLAFEQALL